MSCEPAASPQGLLHQVGANLLTLAVLKGEGEEEEEEEMQG